MPTRAEVTRPPPGSLPVSRFSIGAPLSSTVCSSSNCGPGKWDSTGSAAPHPAVNACSGPKCRVCIYHRDVGGVGLYLGVGFLKECARIGDLVAEPLCSCAATCFARCLCLAEAQGVAKNSI